MRLPRRKRGVWIAAAMMAVAGAVIAVLAWQKPAVLALSEAQLREYTGVYQWEPDAYVYLQLWNELSATKALVAFDESGEVRTWYPTEHDRFFAGPGAAVPTSIESRIEFQRDSNGAIVSLTSARQGGTPRTARRVAIETHENVRFSSGSVQLAGTLIRPATGGRHPVIILVHGSGPADREWTLPFARFLIRHGIAVLGYDKRGVGGSTGDWNKASFDDLAGDVVAAFEYLKARSDIDGRQIGLLGISQAGWVMPLAANRAKDLAFLISISGPGLPASETGLDSTRSEMLANGTPPAVVEHVVGIMKLQQQFAVTGQGWDAYAQSRAKLAAQIGTPPREFPGTPDDPYWAYIRPMWAYDPGPALRQLQVPTLALFGELDNNIVATKNQPAWDTALRAAGNRDYILKTLPKANHIHLEAQAGNNREMPSLQRFVPELYPTIRDWLAQRVVGFR